MDSDAHFRAPVAGLTAAAASVVALLVLMAAVVAFRTMGHAFPGLFLDPYGNYSAVHLPTWGPAVDLRFPDTLVEIDGQRLPQHLRESQRARALEEILRGRPSGTEQKVRLQFERPGSDRPIVVERSLRFISGTEVVFFGLVYDLVALFLVWSAVVVFLISTNRSSTYAYVFWAMGCSLFFLSFFDYHTSRLFTPVFSLSTALVQSGFLLLSYTFPGLPTRGRRVWLSALVVWIGLICLSLVLLFVFDVSGRPTRSLRVFLTLSGAASTGLLLLSVLGRILVGDAHTRAMLRAASVGLVIVPASLAVLYFAAALVGRSWVHLFLPFLAAVIPLSIGYSLIKTNILRTNVVLSRRLLAPACLLAAGVAALLAWLTAAELARRGWISSLTLSIAVAVGLGTFFLCRHLIGPLLFDVAKHFRPTIETLTEELGAVRGLDSAEQAVLRVVRHWLPVRELQLLQAAALDHAVKLSEAQIRVLKAGTRVWFEPAPGERHLIQPMRAFGQLNAAILLGQKTNSAPYSEDELGLLGTIAGLGAIAIHSAGVLSQAEDFRKVAVGAAHVDKRVTLGLLAAELAHELAYPLNFFRYLLDRASSPRGLETEDLDIGREEVERLARMLQTLRRMRMPPANLEKVQLQEPIRRALELNRELIEAKALETTIEVDETTLVLAGFDQMVQIFANLIRNAAEAAPTGGTIGVRSIVTARFLDSIEVWDNGAGIDPDLASSMFSPWATNKPDGHGLGLAVAQRLAHGFQWKLTYHREEPLTFFSLLIKTASEETPRVDESDQHSSC